MTIIYIAGVSPHNKQPASKMGCVKVLSISEKLRVLETLPSSFTYSIEI